MTGMTGTWDPHHKKSQQYFIRFNIFCKTLEKKNIQHNSGQILFIQQYSIDRIIINIDRSFRQVRTNRKSWWVYHPAPFETFTHARHRTMCTWGRQDHRPKPNLSPITRSISGIQQRTHPWTGYEYGQHTFARQENTWSCVTGPLVRTDTCFVHMVL